MSFGFSVSDIVVVTNLACKVYYLCRNSQTEFSNVAADVVSLQIVLEATERSVQACGALDNFEPQLRLVFSRCHDNLSEVEKVLSKYNSLKSHRAKKRESLKWMLESVQDLKGTLATSIAQVTALNGLLAKSSQVRTESKIDSIIENLNRTSLVPTSAPLLDMDEVADISRAVAPHSSPGIAALQHARQIEHSFLNSLNESEVQFASKKESSFSCNLHKFISVGAHDNALQLNGDFGLPVSSLGHNYFNIQARDNSRQVNGNVTDPNMILALLR